MMIIMKVFYEKFIFLVKINKMTDSENPSVITQIKCHNSIKLLAILNYQKIYLTKLK